MKDRWRLTTNALDSEGRNFISDEWRTRVLCMDVDITVVRVKLRNFKILSSSTVVFRVC